MGRSIFPIIMLARFENVNEDFMNLWCDFVSFGWKLKCKTFRLASVSVQRHSKPRSWVVSLNDSDVYASAKVSEFLRSTSRNPTRVVPEIRAYLCNSMANRCGSGFGICHVHYWNHFPSKQKPPQNERDFQFGFVRILLELGSALAFSQINLKLGWRRNRLILSRKQKIHRETIKIDFGVVGTFYENLSEIFPSSFSPRQSAYWKKFCLALQKFFLH
jgi:hypothetical protein